MKQFKAFIITLAMGMCFVAGVATSQEETASSAAVGGDECYEVSMR